MTGASRRFGLDMKERLAGESERPSETPHCCSLLPVRWPPCRRPTPSKRPSQYPNGAPHAAAPQPLRPMLRICGICQRSLAAFGAHSHAHAGFELGSRSSGPDTLVDKYIRAAHGRDAHGSNASAHPRRGRCRHLHVQAPAGAKLRMFQPTCLRVLDWRRGVAC